MNYTREYLRTMGYSLLLPLVNFLGGVIIARGLGVDGKGIVAVINIWSQLGDWILAMGIPLSALVISRRYQERSKSILGASFILSIILGVIKTIVCELLSSTVLMRYTHGVVEYAQFMWLLGVFGIPTVVLTSVLQFHNRIRTMNMFKVIPPIACAIIYLTLFCLHRLGWESTVLIQMLMSAGSFLALVWFTKDYVSFSPFQFVSDTRRLLSYGLRAHLGELTAALNTRLDASIVSLTLTSIGLGIYSVSTNIATIPGTVTGNAASVVTLSMSVGRKRNEFTRYIALSNFITSIFNVLCILGFVLLGKMTIAVLYGGAFLPAYSIACIMLVASFFSGIIGNLTQALYAMERPLSTTLTEGFSLAVLAISMLTLIPRWQLYGAAVSILINQVFKLIIIMYYLAKIAHVNPLVFIIPGPEDIHGLTATVLNRIRIRTQ